MIITSIRQTAPERLTVSFEDGTDIRSTLGVVTELKLYNGRNLDPDAVEDLRIRSLRSIARDRAIEIASRRQMSKKELRTKLMQKGEDAETADYCADWLAENGFLNDERYAGAVARHYAARGYGAGRVKAELGRRGISRDLWDTALDELPEENPKIDKLIASRLDDPNDRDQVRKVSAALYRRGFTWEEIRAGLERYSAEPPDEE